MIVKHIRDGLTEEEHTGYVLTSRLGESTDMPFYLRSCAKPLQASLLFDYGIDEKYSLSSEEIALCCASHAGEKCHTDIAERLLKKFGLKYEWLKCGIHMPLSETRRKEMDVSGEEVNCYHNNCIGKHLLFLVLCKDNGWDIQSYDNVDHPLQKIVKSKINLLCEVSEFEKFPITKDGCGVPILSMPLRNMLKGYLNLFSDKKYEKIKKAFIENPYIIGGENRLDTEIMKNSENVIAKVGAGGLCVIVNPDVNDGVVIKINDCNPDTRRLVAFEALNKLGWSDYKCDKSIKTLNGDVVGEIQIELDF